jgi:hypothetical protein
MVKLIITVGLLATVTMAQGNNSKGCSVRGKVLDDKGSPLANAVVLVDAVPPSTWEDLIFMNRTDSEGRFNYELERCPFPQESRTLYVTSPLSYDNHVPFSPPFMRSKIAGKKFAGQKVRSNRRGNVDLGDIRVQVFFTTVTVRFINKAGQPLLDKDDWEHIWLKLKTANGTTVSEETLSKHEIVHAVRAEESAIMMDLPEGEWQIELQRKGTSWLKANQMIKVPRASAPFAINLQMAKDNGATRR